MADLSPAPVTVTILGRIPDEVKDAICEAARVAGAMLEEVRARRPYWIGGVPTELDLLAARKAVARRLKITPEAVVEALDAALELLPKED